MATSGVTGSARNIKIFKLAKENMFTYTSIFYCN